MAVRVRALTAQYPVAVFFILSYAFSWLVWILGGPKHLSRMPVS